MKKQLISFFFWFSEQEVPCGNIEPLNFDQPIENDSPAEIVRISDASGEYHEVILRPKCNRNRRKMRPIAVISDLFKPSRAKGSANQDMEMVPELPKRRSKCTSSAPPAYSTNDAKPFWNVFKKQNRKQHDQSPPTFRRFQQPLDVDRLSGVTNDSNCKDLEWYDLNNDEMSLIEARLSSVKNQLNIDDTDTDFVHNLDRTQRLTVSSNILWSHNLSMSSLPNVDVSGINLLGANANKDQMHSDVFIEADEINVMYDTVPNQSQRLNYSIESTDSNGYAIMRPILVSNKNKTVEELQSLTIDDITKNINFRRDYESSGSSSGFGSDCETSPESIPSNNSPATSDYMEEKTPSFTSKQTQTPSTAINGRESLENRRCSIKPKNLLHIISTDSNENSESTDVQKTPAHKAKKSIAKKVRKGTPYKLNLTKRFEIYSGNDDDASNSSNENIENQLPPTFIVEFNRASQVRKSPSIAKRIKQKCVDLRKKFETVPIHV